MADESTITIRRSPAARNPQCVGTTESGRQCTDQGSWEVDGRPYCKRHAMAIVFDWAQGGRKT